MPRKKKELKPIVGPGRDERKLTVQKSNPLLSLWHSDMTLPEFKILDTYLSRIDSHHPNKRTVVFTKGELEQLLGVKKINKAELSRRLDRLGRFVELEMASDCKMHKVALFEEAYGSMDENGMWQIQLTCTNVAMKYIFNIDELGYLRYKLRSITNLSSRYSYILFLYLEKNRFRKTWEENVDTLRHLLNCDNDESYSAFKVFNDRILKRCQKELHEKSECRFTYEPVKKGRVVVAVRFTVATLPQLDVPDIDPNQINLFDEGGYTDSSGIYELPEFAEFTPEQLDALIVLGKAKVDESRVQKHKEVLGDIKLSLDFAVADYLREQIVRAKARKPKNLFLYVEKMIENS